MCLLSNFALNWLLCIFVRQQKLFEKNAEKFFCRTLYKLSYAAVPSFDCSCR